MLDFNQVHLKLFMFWDHKNRDKGTRLRGRKNASMRWTYKCLWCISSPEVGIRDIQYPRTKQDLGVTVWFPDKILRVDHGPKNVEELRCVTEVYNHHPSLSIIIYHHLDLTQVFGPLQLPRRPHPEGCPVGQRPGSQWEGPRFPRAGGRTSNTVGEMLMRQWI